MADLTPACRSISPTRSNLTPPKNSKTEEKPMFDHSTSSITTVDGETGVDFVTAPAGLTAAITVGYGTVVRRKLGPIVGYARFDGGESEAVYADASGLRRVCITPADTRYDKDAVLGVLS